MILISYLLTMNTLNFSYKYICNEAVITVILHPTKNQLLNVCHILRNLLCHNLGYILKLEQWLIVMCAIIVKCVFSFNLLMLQKFFRILHMLRIHTGLWKCNKNNVYDIHIRENNSIGIFQPCIRIANSKVFIEIKKDDAIKRNCFFFMLRMSNHVNQLYEKQKSLLTDTIFKYKLRNESAKEVKKPNWYNKTRRINKEDTSKPSPKKCCFVDETNQTSRARSYSSLSNLTWWSCTYNKQVFISAYHL